MDAITEAVKLAGEIRENIKRTMREVEANCGWDCHGEQNLAKLSRICQLLAETGDGPDGEARPAS